jgi:hypothetical protein
MTSRNTRLPDDPDAYLRDRWQRQDTLDPEARIALQPSIAKRLAYQDSQAWRPSRLARVIAEFRAHERERR